MARQKESAKDDQTGLPDMTPTKQTFQVFSTWMQPLPLYMLPRIVDWRKANKVEKSQDKGTIWTCELKANGMQMSANATTSKFSFFRKQAG
jgi:hypothetical protein